ncbi:MAG: TolB family protein [Gaiellaceae bacterium]
MRVLACVLAVLALVAARSAGARTMHTCPHLAASLSYARGGRQHVLSLSTCADRVVGRPRRIAGGLSSRQGRVARIAAVPSEQTIVVDGKPVLRVHEDRRTVPGGAPGPLGLVTWSPDGRWLFYFIDPMGSDSIAADGLVLRALDVATGRSVPVGKAISLGDYVTWCGSTLVMSAGGDRIATHHKRLVAATAPTWKPRLLWDAPSRAFGSVTCNPDGESVAVLSQRDSTDAFFFAARWQLWQVTLDGRRFELDRPPRGCADESPAWSPDGSSLAFVRERKGYGAVMVLHGDRTYGPLADLGYSLGYYGHHDWGIAWRR